MSRHRYQRRALSGDFARAGIGAALCLGAAAVAGFAGFTAWLFGVCAVIFLLFGLRTLLRSVTNYELTDMGLTRSYATGFGRSERALAWQGLEQLRLRFFPAKRDRSQGWMELTLVGARARLRLDSTLGNFDAIVRAAVGAAARRRLALSESTLSNLAALGIAVAQADGGNGMNGGSPTRSARR
jgi:hypothetical protein